METNASEFKRECPTAQEILKAVSDEETAQHIKKVELEIAAIVKTAKAMLQELCTEKQIDICFKNKFSDEALSFAADHGFKVAKYAEGIFFLEAIK